MKKIELKSPFVYGLFIFIFYFIFYSAVTDELKSRVFRAYHYDLFLLIRFSFRSFISECDFKIKEEKSMYVSKLLKDKAWRRYGAQPGYEPELMPRDYIERGVETVSPPIGRIPLVGGTVSTRTHDDTPIRHFMVSLID